MIETKLFEMQDLKYKAFHSKLMPTVNPDKVIGVRVPLLRKFAKEFSKIDDTTYIAKLRDDVYWHDGTKFTAKDVIFTVNNLKKDSVKSIYKENVNIINEIKNTITILVNIKILLLDIIFIKSPFHILIFY